MPPSKQPTLKSLIGQLERIKSGINQFISQLQLLQSEASQQSLAKSSGILKHDVTNVQSIVCLHYNISIEQMLSKRRTQVLADARAVGLWLAHKRWNKIASLAPLFNMTRSNAIYQIKRVNSDPLLLATAQHLKKVIK